MQNNPYDDLLKNLARLIEQLASMDQRLQQGGTRQSENSQIFGCAIIAGTGIPRHAGNDCRTPCHSPQEVPYEMTDTGEKAYLTVQISVPGGETPEISFKNDICEIDSSGSSGRVHLPFRIIPDQCTWSYRNGILDAVLVKEEENPSIPSEPEQDTGSGNAD